MVIFILYIQVWSYSIFLPYDWFIFFSIISLMSIHAEACDKIFLKASKSSIFTSFSIHLCMDVWICPTSWLLWYIYFLIYTGSKYLFEILLWVVLGEYPKMGWIGETYSILSFYILQESPYYFLQWLHYFTFSPKVLLGSKSPFL